ncbi:MAG: aminotransferase class I/II-fold pyridoxal phosphate-dependent enzyme, partial [Ottowia sp.]|nr:aminotransferase class I/II-fold pyridoxal phosphate-dependent enzyme [Ottowia sp.]
QRIIAAQGAAGGIAVIDEAYQPFAARTWLDEVQPERDAHVLIMRTLSKFGLAGVRLGYLMGDARLIAEIDKVRPPYNVGVLNLECALFALEHADEFARQAADIRAQRARLMNELAALPGCTVWPSEGNMVLLRVAGTAEGAQRIFEGMKAHGVLVKHVSAMHPQLVGCLRLTVGNADENTHMLAALRAALQTP